MIKNFPDWAVYALKTLKENGFEAYFVGGCVRDLLLGHSPHDIDIATSALPDQVATCFSAFPVIKTGIRHGTVSILIHKNPIEITTFRKDGPYSDNRHPDAVSFTESLWEDTARRDFTINAMACDEFGEITDFWNGKNDLEKRILRCVGEPEIRFSEDALRIFRALRFSSVLSFQIEEHTADAIFKGKERLTCVASERLFSEFCKILCGRGAEPVLLRFAAVFGVVIPELLLLMGFEQRNPHHI